MNGSVKADVGFIGCGGIASALTRGLCSSDGFKGIVYVYDHHAEKTEAVKADYPDRIVVVSSDQEVVDNAQVIVPAIVPAALEKVAPGLKFERRHHIIHLAAAVKLAQAAPWFSPAQAMVRAVPLSFAARRIGPIVLFGDDGLSESLLSLVGTVVKVEREKDLEVLAAVTGVMVPYYGLVGEIVRWCMSRGMDFRSAMDYTCFMNEALSKLMRMDCTEDIDAFMSANATPGGMNELAWGEMKAADAYKPWRLSLDKIGRKYGV